jgi:hypothetical protein
MKGREYTSSDMRRMQQALAIVTAYDMGVEPNEFDTFKELVDEAIANDDKMVESLAQFAWMLIRSIEASSGVDRTNVLKWYGERFAYGAEQPDA